MRPKKEKTNVITKSNISLLEDTLGRGLTAAALRQLDVETLTAELEDDLQSVASRLVECFEGSKKMPGYNIFFFWGGGGSYSGFQCL